jgi:hypothetical protein
MMLKPKIKYEFKSYKLEQKANPVKEKKLWDLYSVYKSEYKNYVHNYWHNFQSSKSNTLIKVKSNKFSHLGSTKEIKTKLNSAYLQICLFQSCSLLNNYLSNIEEKFNEILNNSSLSKDSKIVII